MPDQLASLRAQAVNQTMFAPTTLKAALEKLGFVQADPIRAPAAAQDLILRQRVKGYRAGDLERKYASLDIEEDLLYAYGFLARPYWKLLHPRNTRDLSKLEKQVLAVVARSKEIHPRDLEEHLGKERITNAWGGYSKATTRALEDLHYRGLLRIVRREKGIRIYAATSAFAQDVPPAERLRELVLLIARILAPVPKRSLQETARRLRYAVPNVGDTTAVIADMLRTGELEERVVDGVSYVAPSSSMKARVAVPRVVRFLAPFDPVVWDRRRFEHLWGWVYRFEAYTPPAKRVRGYYALPLLWGDEVIGWANASMTEGALTVEPGFVGKRPRDAEFRRELDAEIERLRAFLA